MSEVLVEDERWDSPAGGPEVRTLFPRHDHLLSGPGLRRDGPAELAGEPDEQPRSLGRRRPSSTPRDRWSGPWTRRLPSGRPSTRLPVEGT